MREARNVTLEIPRDEFRALGVRANADTPEQVTNAVAFGAEGVGLCRTEHMFFEGDRIDAMREMILAETKDARVEALKKLAGGRYRVEGRRVVFE